MKDWDQVSLAAESVVERLHFHVSRLGPSFPTLASNEVALVVAPPHVEVAAVAVGVGSIALAIRIEKRTSAKDPCR